MNSAFLPKTSRRSQAHSRKREWIVFFLEGVAEQAQDAAE